MDEFNNKNYDAPFSNNKETYKPRNLIFKKLGISAELIGILLVLVFLILALFGPWYCFSIQYDYDGVGRVSERNSETNFYLFHVENNDYWYEGFDEKTESIENKMDYDDLLYRSKVSEAGLSYSEYNAFDILDYTFFIILGAFIATIIFLLYRSLFVFQFLNNPKLFKNISLLFGIIILLFSITAIIYFSISWTNIVLGESETLNYFSLSNFGKNSFWYTAGSSSGETAIRYSSGPGYSWYLTIIAGIIALISSISMIKKPNIYIMPQFVNKKSYSTKVKKIENKKILLVVFAVALIIISSIFLFFSSSSDEKDKFEGTWTVIENYISYSDNISIKFQNDGRYETPGGNSGRFEVNNGKICFSEFLYDLLSKKMCYNYDFSDDGDQFTLKIENHVVMVFCKSEQYEIDNKQHVYFSNPQGPRGGILLLKNDIEDTLTVIYLEDSENLWDDFYISGQCNTSKLGKYVTKGDQITNCNGTLALVHKYSSSVIGEWKFN